MQEHSDEVMEYQSNTGGAAVDEVLQPALDMGTATSIMQVTSMVFSGPNPRDGDFPPTIQVSLNIGQRTKSASYVHSDLRDVSLHGRLQQQGALIKSYEQEISMLTSELDDLGSLNRRIRNAGLWDRIRYVFTRSIG